MPRSSRLAILATLLWAASAAAQGIGPAPSPAAFSGGTVTTAVTAPSFIPNGAACPTNGLNLPAANTVGFCTNSIQGFEQNATQQTSLGFGNKTFTTGSLLDINANTAAPSAFSQSGASAGLNITAADATKSIIQINSFGAHGFIVAQRSGGTAAAPTANGTSDTLIHIRGAGYDSAAYTTLGATLAAIPTQTWSVGANGVAWYIYATANGANGSTPVNPTVAIQTGVSIGRGAPTVTDPGAGALSVAGVGLFGTVTAAVSNSIFDISNNAAQPVAAPAGTLLHITGLDNTSQAYIVADAFAANAARPGSFTFRMARGTAATPTATNSGDSVGELRFAGFGTAFAVINARVRAVAAELFTASAQGMYLDFQTTPATTATIASSMRLQASGGLSVGSASVATDPGNGGILGSGTISTTSTTDATTTTSGSFQVAGGAAIRKRVFIDGITTSSGLQTAVLCQSSGGEMIADSVACLASSARFKNLLGSVEDGALAKIAILPLYRWSYKPEGMFRNEVEHVGPIAEDVAAMDSRLAGYDNDGNVRTYSTEQLLTYTIKALQEANDRIDRLERR